MADSKKKPDIIIFEGWCVGATPQKNKDLIKPINLLEKEKDKRKIWRNKVNNELKMKYKKIFNLIELIIFLKVPSFKHVFKWRLLQEKKLKLSSKGKKIMKAMKKQYGKEAEAVFYASKNKGVIKGVDKKRKTKNKKSNKRSK